jgi:hypothetical protein
MANAAPGRPSLLPSDLRRMFRDPDLGKPIAKSEGIGGAMPSIRKIARHLGLARALPVAMVATGPHSFLMAQLDADDRLMLREWTAQNGWSAPLEATLDEPFELSPGTPAMTYWHETVAHDGMKVRIVMAGVRSTLREYWFWYPGWTGGPDSAHALKSAMSKPGTVCEGTDVAMVRLGNAATIAAIDCQGDLTVMMGQANPLANLTRPPIVVGRDFQGCVGPVMAVAGLPFQESIELVAIDQTGRLRWFRRPWANLPEWTAPTDLLPGAVPTVALDPAVKPALLAGPAELMVVAAGADGLLYACRISPLLEFVGELVPVDITVRIARQGPVALAMGSDGRPAAMAVGADGLLRIASFDYVTESWSDFDIVDPVTPVSPAGGVTAISLNGDLFIMAVLPNGQPCLTFQIPNIGGWFRLREVGQRELPIL